MDIPHKPEPKSAICPYRLAQKSILLVKEEIQFTGQPLEDKINSWVLRLKLTQMEVNKRVLPFRQAISNGILLLVSLSLASCMPTLLEGT